MKKSILSGILIGLSSYIYINCENKIVGAFIFPLALILILKLDLNLFTGKICSLEFNLTDLFVKIKILIGNLIGTCFLIPFYNESYVNFVSSKVELSFVDTLTKAFICGMLMCLAVSFTEGKKNFLFTIMCVAGFLLAKAEHSIADIAYVMISHSFNLETLYFILTAILGNTLGGIFMYQAIRRLS